MLHVGIYEALLCRRHLVGLVADHFADIGGRHAHVFADARLVKVFSDALANGARAKCLPVNLYEERIPLPCLQTGVALSERKFASMSRAY